MSSKNKIQNKATRRATREDTSSLSPRTPLGRIPSAVAARVLSNPKQKLTGKQRRKFQSARGFVVGAPITPAREPAVKLALKLTKLSLVTLHRRLAQSARRAATAKEILSELSPGSQFAAGIAQEQTHQLGVFKQVKAEILSRK